jgi:hypothetical protein
VDEWLCLAHGDFILVSGVVAPVAKIFGTVIRRGGVDGRQVRVWRGLGLIGRNNHFIQYLAALRVSRDWGECLYFARLRVFVLVVGVALLFGGCGLGLDLGDFVEGGGGFGAGGMGGVEARVAFGLVLDEREGAQHHVEHAGEGGGAGGGDGVGGEEFVEAGESVADAGGAAEIVGAAQENAGVVAVMRLFGGVMRAHFGVGVGDEGAALAAGGGEVAAASEGEEFGACFDGHGESLGFDLGSVWEYRFSEKHRIRGEEFAG